MRKDVFDYVVKQAEGRNRGWLIGGKGAPPCDVYIDGKLVRRCVAVNRRKGIARLAHDPVKLDKHRKNIRFYTVRGKIEVVSLGLCR